MPLGNDVRNEFDSWINTADLVQFLKDSLPKEENYLNADAAKVSFLLGKEDLIDKMWYFIDEYSRFGVLAEVLD